MYRKILALLLLLLLCGMAVAEAPVEAPAEVPAGTAAEAPAAADDGEPAPTPQPAKGYVLVSTATRMGFLPLPEEGEYSYHLEQILPDGTPAENVIHLTPDGVWMEESTCDNHDCIDQGHVTLDNRRDRVLGNMIICLPNQVTLQLMTPEEISEIVEDRETEP